MTVNRNVQKLYFRNGNFYFPHSSDETKEKRPRDDGDDDHEDEPRAKKVKVDRDEDADREREKEDTDGADKDKEDADSVKGEDKKDDKGRGKVRGMCVSRHAKVDSVDTLTLAGLDFFFVAPCHLEMFR